MGLVKKIHLRDDEQIFFVIRQYALTYAWRYFTGLIFLFIPSFFMFRLFVYGWWGYTLYGLGMLAGLFIIWRTWFYSRHNIFVITNERVVDIQRLGWFKEIISSAGYLDIKDMSIEKNNIWQSIFNYGNLVIQTRSQQFVWEISKIYNPQKIHALIFDLGQRYRQNRRVADTQAIYHNFIKIISELPIENLESAQELIRIQLERRMADRL